MILGYKCAPIANYFPYVLNSLRHNVFEKIKFE